jgi:hypothetical protein
MHDLLITYYRMVKKTGNNPCGSGITKLIAHIMKHIIEKGEIYV